MISLITFAINTYADELDLSSWQKTVALARGKAKIKDFNFIIDHLTAPEFKMSIKAKHGKDWRAIFVKEKLSSLRYYYGWLRKSTVTQKGDRVNVAGEHGCHGSFVKVNGKWLICNFGQKLTSM